MRASALAALCRVVLPAWLVCGCAVTTTCLSDGTVSRTLSLGIPPRLPRIEAGRIAQTAFGIGIARGFGGVGYLHTELAILPRDCGAIIIADNPDQIAGIFDLSTACDGDNHETRPDTSAGAGSGPDAHGLHGG